MHACGLKLKNKHQVPPRRFYKCSVCDCFALNFTRSARRARARKHEPHTDSFLVTVVVVRRACLAVAHSSRHVVVAAAGDGAAGAGGGGVALAVYMHRDPV